MVLLHITKGTDEFIFECLCSDRVGDVSLRVARLHNTRRRMKRICEGIRQLAMYGPMKPEAERGLTPEQINALGSEQRDIPGADPLGLRVGQPPAPAVALTMAKVAEEAEAVISNNHAKLRKPISPPAMEEALRSLSGVVMMAYPMGLPEFDQVRQAIEDKENLQGSEESKMLLDEETAVLWFAGKQLERDEPMSRYTGKNEKVMLKARIEARSAGAPQREPAIDGETQKKLMALWHKKEQENKLLESADEDSYLNSEWANPKGYKSAMNGIGDIKFRPTR